MNNIDLDYADYKTIKEHKGFCIGYNSEVVLIKNLDVADESMMSWMADFGKFRSMNKAKDEEKITYLNKEKEKISEVSKMMKQAITEGTNYLSTKN